MLISGIQPFTTLDFPGQISCIVWTAGCNFRCGYCHNPEFVLPEKLKELRDNIIPEIAVLRFLESRVGKLDGVVVSGGEPTLQHGLIDFVSEVKELGFLVKLDTNGTNPEVVEQLLQEELIDYIAMDYKVPLTEYQIVSGPFKHFGKIAQTRDLVMQSARPYEFRATVLQEVHTPERLQLMAEELNGSARLYLQQFRPGHVLDDAYSAYTPFSQREMEHIAEMFRLHVSEVFVRT